jgi:carbonic anhydrase
MVKEYYQKQVIGSWFSPYTKEEVEISVLTRESTIMKLQIEELANLFLSRKNG